MLAQIKSAIAAGLASLPVQTKAGAVGAPALFAFSLVTLDGVLQAAALCLSMCVSLAGLWPIVTNWWKNRK